MERGKAKKNDKKFDVYFRFKMYQEWDKKEFEEFIKEYGFSVVEWNCASIYAGRVSDILS